MLHKKIIKFFLEADSKEELVEKMIENNDRFDTGFDYDCPQKDGKKWVTWFSISAVQLASKKKVTTNE